MHPLTRTLVGLALSACWTNGESTGQGALFSACYNETRHWRAGDIDGDLRDDLALGSITPGGGVVRVVSGATGQIIHQFLTEEFAEDMGGVGDLDGDGAFELWSIDRNYVVRVHSGRTGVAMLTVQDSSIGGLRMRVAGIGDLDRDGRGDLVFARGSARILHVVSGRDGATLVQYVTVASAAREPSALASAGDVNLDGVQDVVLGVDSEDTAYVCSGADGTLLRTVSGASVGGGKLGRSVAGGADLDGDGVDDFVVGLPFDVYSSGVGRVWVVSGSTGVLIHDFVGRVLHDRFGEHVAIVGDMDGDGVADVAASTSFGSPGGPDVYSRVYSGATGALLEEFEDTWAIGPAGDLNGDGYADALAAGRSNGCVHAFDLGMAITARPLEVPFAIARYDGDWLGDLFGRRVESLGDATSDGADEIVVSSGAYTRVFSGRTGEVLHEFDGNSFVTSLGDVDADGHNDVGTISGGTISILSGDGFATLHGSGATPVDHPFVEGVGDLNADGFDDLVLYGSVGSAVAWSGRGLTTLWEVTGDRSASFAWQVRGIGDVNRDGSADVVITQPGNGTLRGMVMAVSGSDASVLWRRFEADSTTRPGFELAVVGDLTGDGVDDVCFTVGGRNPQSVRVVSGSDGTTIFEVPFPSLSVPWDATCGAGDWNADGIPDFAASRSIGPDGAPYGFVSIYSGRDATPIATIVGTWFSRFGIEISGPLDTDGDGLPEIAVGGPNADRNGIRSGSAWILEAPSPSGALPGHARVFGVGCPLPGVERTPRVDVAGRSFHDRTFVLGLRGARSNAPAVMHIGDSAPAIALDGLGMIGCSLLVRPWLALPVTTDQSGVAQLPLTLTPTTVPTGAEYVAQWAILDPSANVLGVATSNGLRFSIGGQR